MTLLEFLESFENLSKYRNLNVYSTDYIAKHLEHLETKDYLKSQYLTHDIQSFSTFNATIDGESEIAVYVYLP